MSAQIAAMAEEQAHACRLDMLMNTLASTAVDVVFS